MICILELVLCVQNYKLGNMRKGNWSVAFSGVARVYTSPISLIFLSERSRQELFPDMFLILKTHCVKK